MKTKYLILLLNLFCITGYAQNADPYYDYIHYLNGFAVVSCNSQFGRWGTKNGIIDRNFNLIVPMIYDRFLYDDYSSVFYKHTILGERGDIFDLIDDSGNVLKSFKDTAEANKIYYSTFEYPLITKTKYGYSINDYKYFNYVVFNINRDTLFKGMYYIIEEGLQDQFIVLPVIRDSTFSYDKHQISDIHGNILFTKYYNSISASTNGRYYWAMANDTCRPLDRNLNPINDFFCQSISSAEPYNNYWVKIDNKWGLIDSNFKFIIQPKFQYAFTLGNRDSISVITMNNHEAFFNNNGIQLTDFIYHIGVLDKFSDDIISIKRGDVAQILNYDFECIFGCDSTREVLEFDGQNNLMVKGRIENYKKTGEWIYYHPNGQKIMEECYENGLEEGKSVLYYSDGEIRSVLYYSKGRLIYREIDDDFHIFCSPGCKHKSHNNKN